MLQWTLNHKKQLFMQSNRILELLRRITWHENGHLPLGINLHPVKSDDILLYIHNVSKPLYF